MGAAETRAEAINEAYDGDEVCMDCERPEDQCICCPDCDGLGILSHQGTGDKWECPNCDGAGFVL